MKKILILTTAVIIMSAVTYAQEKTATAGIHVPPGIKQSFTNDFPGTKSKWEKEGDKYEVNFVYEGKDMSVVYDANGNKQETETGMKISDLPIPVKNYLVKNYKGQKIKGAAIITKSNGEVNYEAEIKGRDVLFNKDGTFIKTSKD